MNPETILNLPKYHRKTFISLIFAVFIIALLLDWILSDLPVKEVILGYVRAIAGSILITLLVLWTLVSFFPPLKSEEGISELQPGKMTAEFKDQLGEALRWRYKGNFGRYMRGKVLPTLAEKQNAHITACIIDPRITLLCERHAIYRNRYGSADNGKLFDADSVAVEALVTIIMCAWYVANKDMIIDLFVSQVFDPLRIDSSDSSMILTVEDRKKPALKITKGHFTYENFELQMKIARDQGQRIKLNGVRGGIELAEINTIDIVNAANAAEMLDLCNRLGAETVLTACRAAKNAYE